MEIKKVIERIRPPAEESRAVREIANDVVGKLKRATDCGVVLAGSVAKGTALAGEGDIDVFVLFRKRMKKEEMKKRLETIFRKAFPGTAYQMNYAEHPYIRFHHKGKRIDVVPAYRISAGQGIFTAVDRSVLHTRFVLKNLGERQKDEVRLLKKFLRSAELYGAEIKTEGFSGYLCELLIISYGSFLGLLRSAAKWRLPLVIDLKKHYKKSEYQILLKKFNKSLVVIDPTDKNRNVSAPLSEDNIRKFVKLAKRFIKKPSEKYFFRQPTFDEKLKKLGKKGFVTVVSFPRSEAVDDVLWGQVKKLTSTLKKALCGFGISEIIADAGREVVIAIATGRRAAGGIVETKGPPLRLKKHVARFRKAHRKSRFLVRRGFVFAIEKKPRKEIADAVREVLKQNAFRFSHLQISKARISHPGQSFRRF